MIKALKCVSRIKMIRETIIKCSNWWAREHLNGHATMRRNALINYIGWWTMSHGGGSDRVRIHCAQCAQTKQCDNVRRHINWRMNNQFVKLHFEEYEFVSVFFCHFISGIGFHAIFLLFFSLLFVFAVENVEDENNNNKNNAPNAARPYYSIPFIFFVSKNSMTFYEISVRRWKMVVRWHSRMPHTFFYDLL